MSCPHCCPEEHAAITGDGWRCLQGSSEILLRSEPDDSFDAVISDPPYAAGATSLLGRLQSSATKYQNSDTKNRLPPIAGDSMLPDAWQFMMTAVVTQCYRILKPGGTLLFFCDWRSLNGMMSAVGSVFTLRSALIWNKGRGCRPHKNGFRSQSEMILWAKKPGNLDRDEPVYLDGVFSHSTRTGNKVHLTEKPLGLMRDLLQIAPPSGSICDPFQGSGTTGVAAIEMGLQYLGIEATEHYHHTAVARLQATAPLSV